MSLLTFQILEGMERGQVLSGLTPPITIGREEDNAIQLNDERCSRFHAKIQENAGRIILTDLESTNGTRVNGHAVKMHVLQFGDQISIGRSLLVFGSTSEIESEVQRVLSAIGPTGTVDGASIPHSPTRDDDEEVSRLFPRTIPELPNDLTGLQLAQLTDLVAHLHDRLHSVIYSATILGEGTNRRADVNGFAWQRLLKVEMDLASYLKQLGEGDR